MSAQEKAEQIYTYMNHNFVQPNQLYAYCISTQKTNHIGRKFGRHCSTPMGADGSRLSLNIKGSITFKLVHYE